MEAKKTLKADLQNKRLLFFETGMAFSLLVVIVAFAWSKKEIEEPVYSIGGGGIGGPISEIVPVTKEPPKGTTRPQQKVQQNVDIIRIVLDETEIVEEIDFNEFDADAVFAETAGIGVLGVGGDGGPGGGGVFTGDEVFDVVEDMPKFQGKDPSAFITWVLSKVEYPQAARERNIQGRVYVSYIVEKDGTLSNVEAAAGADPILAAEAIRIVKSSPRWTPGRQRNKPARVKMAIPVLFKINSF